MKHLYFTAIALLTFQSVFHQHGNAAIPLTSGNITVYIKEFTDESSGEKTLIFLPDTQKIVPCFIFCHAFEEEYQSYSELIFHCVSKGASVLYVPARKVSFTRNKIRNYDFGIASIFDAVHSVNIIDTSRIIIIGHGFGAGAVPGLMKHLREKGWGSNTAMMYLMSPWYLYSIVERQLSAYPDDVSMVIEVFENDNYNDPMIAADIFTRIGIPTDRKAFLIARSDKVGTRRSIADYVLPLGDQSFTGKCNYLDTIAIFNVIDSLYLFGFGKTRSTDSSFLKPSHTFNMVIDKRADGDSVPPVMVTDSPFVHIPNGPYLNPWKSVRNPRIEVSRFRKFRKLTMKYRMNKVNQVSRYIVKKVAADLDRDSSETPVNPIDSGFGADGPFKITELVCSNPLYPEQKVYTFLPESIKTPVPVLLFLHGYNGGDPTYFSHLIPHIVSNGTGLIFPTYSSFPSVNSPEIIQQKYDMLYSGISEAFRLHGDAFDSTRIGIFGHSFGGGAVPWIALKTLNEKKWGTDAAFLFVSAPWYVCGVSDSAFSALPPHLKAVIVTYGDDAFNDHQMAVDMFTHLNSADTEKRFYTFVSDTLDSMAMVANHFTPYGIENINGVQDNFDYFGIFKLFDALSSYCFLKNSEGRDCALGNNSKIQNWMGVWPDGAPVKPMLSTTSPKAVRAQKSFVFTWDNTLNPRYRGSFPSRGK